ncbi:MAG: ABC transporter ATP-binding protein [Methylocystaceae bacterium]
MNRDVLMQINEISKTYIMGEVKVPALNQTSLNIYQGEILVILGPSGSGKSTLLNIIGGMDRSDTGEIIFRGHDLCKADDNRLTMFRRNEVGFVFQFYNLISDLTALENVELAAELVKEPLDAAEILAQVGLGERKNHFPVQLSGGEQQRISIARGIVKKPALLLCDEPTGALDFETGRTILQLLKEVNQKLNSSVVIVTHNTAIGDMADRVIRMRSGAIVDIAINEMPLMPERIEW